MGAVDDVDAVGAGGSGDIEGFFQHLRDLTMEAKDLARQPEQPRPDVDSSSTIGSTEVLW